MVGNESDLDFYKVSSQRGYPPEGIGIEAIKKRYFGRTPEGLFDSLTGVPQDLEGIKHRQKVFGELIKRRLDEKFEESSLRLEEIEPRLGDYVKVWKEVYQKSWGYEREPLIFDPTKLRKAVGMLREVSESLVSSLEGTRSEVLRYIGNHFSQYLDPSSKVSKEWSEDERIYSEDHMPFFAFLAHDSWTRDVETVFPIGLVENSTEIKEEIKRAFERGTREATIKIDRKEYSIILTEKHFGIKGKKGSVRRQRDIHIDRRLFHNIFREITRSEGLIKNLSFYLDGMRMYRDAESKRLPMCIPEVTNSSNQIFELIDFYPFFEELPNERRYVKNSISFGGEEPTLFVTGLNSGGKSTLLRTLGFIATTSRAGLPVPARRATVPNLDEIMYEEPIGDDYRDHLSTFRAQSRNLVGILKSLPINPRKLLLFNEPLSGTDPETQTEGMLTFLRALSQEHKVLSAVESHCTTAGYEVLENQEEYNGTKSVCFKMKDGRKRKPDFKLYEGVGKSEGSYVLEEEGLTIEKIKTSIKRKKER